MKYIVSAPGKIILFGEHSVVYGKSAIAAAIDKRTNITLEELERNEHGTTGDNDDDAMVRLELADFDYTKDIALSSVVNKQKESIPLLHRGDTLILATPELIDHVQLIRIVNNDVNEFNHSLAVTQVTALTAIFYLLRAMFAAADCQLKRPVRITVQSDLNVGAGTGSSASFSVSLAALFFHYIMSTKDSDIGDPTTKRETLTAQTFSDRDLLVINKWSLNLEHIFHGNASGLDNFVATYGSIVHASNNPDNRRTLNVMSSGGMLRILLVYSGVPRSTMRMVEKVSELRKRNPVIVDHILSAMDAVATDAISVLKQIGSLHTENPIGINSLNEEILRLQDLIDINHGLLTSLTVSHRCLNEIVDIASSFNLHAKLTGAGGGGYVYALIPPWITPEIVNDCIEALSGKGYDAFDVKLGCSGLTLHTD